MCFWINLLCFTSRSRRLSDIDITKHTSEFKSFGKNGVRKVCSLCGTTYCTCITWCVIGTLTRIVLGPIAKARTAEVNAIRTVLGILRRMFILVRVLLA
jgi:hypothetical protein